MKGQHDEAFAKMLAWLKCNGLQARTTRKDRLEIARRQPKFSRLTGERR